MCLGYETVTADYGVASKTATDNNVNLQQCDGSDAQIWAFVSPQPQQCRSAFIATQLTAVLFDVSGIKWPDLKYEGWLH